jgi:hypothetical protein
VTSHLAHRLPTRFLEGFGCVPPGKVGEFSHPPTRPPRFPVVRASWGVRRRPSGLQPTAMP